MNTLDLFILAALAGGLVIGFRSGLIKQVFSLVGTVVAFVLAISLMKGAGTLAADSLGLSPRIAPVVGFVLIFSVVQLGVFALTRMLETLVGALKLTWVNRMFGGAMGAFKASLLLSVAFLVLSLLNVPGPMSREASLFYEPVSASLPGAWNYLSDRLPQIESLAERFKTGEPAEEEAAPADSTGRVAEDAEEAEEARETSEADEG